MYPTISVLLPVHNAERYLRAAIDSVLSQSLVDFELLVLDDGSTDRSLTLLHELTSGDRRVRLLTRRNRGLVQTLNELIAQATGQYIARMDADDICMAGRFAKQAAFLDNSPDHVLVAGWIERINARGQPIGIYPSPCSHDEIDQAHLRGLTSICHPTVMLRKDAILKAGCYRAEFEHAEDLDLWLRMAELGKIANLPEVVLQYRMHASSISEAKGKAQQDAMRRACESAWARRGIEEHFEVTEHWRPGGDRQSRHQFALESGWVAWHNGHRATWWTCARTALAMRPFAVSSWKLLVFGFLKSPPQRTTSGST
jgi:glycosyltransferase involved in cell wall biosynthesis